MILVNKPFLPPKGEYIEKLESIWSEVWLTNNGPYVQQLEQNLKDYLKVPSFHYVTNGTTALQLAIKALNLHGEIITTPFSFVATTSSIIWEHCTPIYVDILPDTFCIDADKIEAAITENTTAILATHVFGIPCDVEKIEAIAKRNNLKVIYDAAHAFDVKYKGKSILTYGDISIISLHATKTFHTVEGGALINNRDEQYNEKIKLLRSFGAKGEEYTEAGINAKNSEFHALMGLCNMKYLASNLVKRKAVFEKYNQLIPNNIKGISIYTDVEYNYSYYPIVFEDEQTLAEVKTYLYNNGVQTRRYFYPSLNTMPYLVQANSCPISENIAHRILCLPFYVGLTIDEVERIGSLINEIVK